MRGWVKGKTYEFGFRSAECGVGVVSQRISELASMGKTSKVQSWGPGKCGVANMEASGQVQMVEKSMLLRARDGSRSGGGGLGRFHAGNGRPTNGIGEAGGDHRSPLQGQGKLILSWTASVLPRVRESGVYEQYF